MAVNNNAFGEDPWCSYEPKKGNTHVINIATAIQFGLEDAPSKKDTKGNNEVTWTEEAQERLKKIPFFCSGHCTTRTGKTCGRK